MSEKVQDSALRSSLPFYNERIVRFIFIYGILYEAIGKNVHLRDDLGGATGPEPGISTCCGSGNNNNDDDDDDDDNNNNIFMHIS